MSQKYKQGDELDIHIEKIVPRGFGIGFAENLTVMAALAAPGDRLRVRLKEVKKRLAFAEIVEVLAASPHRQIPPCRHFGICGGCNFQQITAEAQRAAKVGIIEDCLRRIGKIDLSDPIQIISSPADLGYRSRARWHFDDAKIGYLKRDSHEVVDIAECPIITTDLQKVLSDLRESLASGRSLNDRGEIEAATSGGGSSIFSRDLTEIDRELTAVIGPHKYRYSARTFFQANQTIVAELIEAAISGATGTTAWDLYSGVGLFTLPLADAFDHVVAVEAQGSSTEYARINVDRAGMRNVTLKSIGVGKFLEDSGSASVDFVLLDPPRSGTEDGAIERLAALRPRQISYVSCEPSILARDLRKLLDAGYRIERIVALDLFPQTHHVETVARLSCDSEL